MMMNCFYSNRLIWGGALVCGGNDSTGACVPPAFPCPIGNACLALFRLAGIIVTRYRLFGGGHPAHIHPENALS
jgi:hypothetical protein